jgi:DUF971 family protein
MKAPISIHYHRKSRLLDVAWPDGTRHALASEYLRVFSPSAEVRGHTGGEPIVVPGKRNVTIERIEPVGSYAVRLVFDDGHATGLYSWDVLADLGTHHDRYWARYLERLAEHGLSRDSEVTKLSALPPAPKKWKPGG